VLSRSVRGPALGLLAVNLPLLVAAAIAIAEHPTVIPASDTAVTETSVIDASHLTQTVGPYSRYGWSHPGPAWFYLLAPVYRLLGGSSYALAVGSLVLLALAASAVVVLMARRYGGLGGLLAALAVLAYLHAVGLDLLRNPWNPWAVLLPTGLLAVLAAAGAAGSAAALLGALVVGSFLVQTHVSTVLTVVALIATAGLLARLTRRVDAAATSRPGRVALALGGAAVVAMWAPPLVQQVTGHPGNLGQLVHYVRHPNGSFGGDSYAPYVPGDHPSVHEAVSTTGLELGVLPFGGPGALTGGEGVAGPRGRAVALLLYGIGSAALVLLGLLRRERFALGAGAVTLVGIVVAAVSVTQVVDPLFPYLVAWITAIPIGFWLGWAALGITAVRGRDRLRPALTAAAAVMVAVAAGAGTVTAARLGPLSGTATPAGADPVAARLWTLVDQRLHDGGDGPVLVHIASLDGWPAAAAILDQLYREGRPAAVDPKWVFLFGERFHPTGAERWRVVLVDSSQAATLAPPGAERLGQAGTLAAYLEPAGEVSGRR
jgi:hypothetical protein